MKRLHAVISLATIAFAAALTNAQTTATFEPKQTVEVREGDIWSKATVVAKEGRRYQIKYEDGTLEWVTADRLRVSTGAGDAKTSDPAKSAKPKVVWQIDQKVEVKWGGLWSEATIVNRRGEWLLVQYTQGKRKEWVEPWRLRKPGDTTDVPYASPNPVVHRNEGPPREKPGEAPETSEKAKGDDPFAPEKFDFKLTPADAKSAKSITTPASVTWSYKPGAAAAAPVISLPTKGPLQQGADVSGLSVEGGKALVGYALGRGNEKGSSVEWIGVKSKQSVQLKIDKASRPIALMPDGERLLAQAAGFFSGTKHRVDLWKLTPTAAEHELSFVPYGDAGKAKDIVQLVPVDAEHVLTTSDREVTLWSTKNAKGVWRIATKATPAIALSPDRASLAVADGAQVMVLNSTTGDVQGVLQSRAGAINALAFSPSGKRLFANAGGSVAVFDMEKGAFLTSLATSRPATTLLALSDRLVDTGTCVLNVEKPGAIATLKHGQVRSNGGVLLAHLEGPTPSLFAVSLPLKELETLADTQESATVVHLKPGTAIACDVSLDSANSGEIADAMRSSLTKGGLKVADDAPLRLIARTENGKSEERMYEDIGGPMMSRERLKITVTEKITRLWLEQNGKKIWERSVSAWPGMMIDRKEGQSLPDAVAAANVPNVEWLRNVELPAAIVDLDGLQLPAKALVPGGLK